MDEQNNIRTKVQERAKQLSSLQSTQLLSYIAALLETLLEVNVASTSKLLNVLQEGISIDDSAPINVLVGNTVDVKVRNTVDVDIYNNYS